MTQQDVETPFDANDDEWISPKVLQRSAAWQLGLLGLFWELGAYSSRTGAYSVRILRTPYEERDFTREREREKESRRRQN
jgi:hypothetical protein